MSNIQRNDLAQHKYNLKETIRIFRRKFDDFLTEVEELTNPPEGTRQRFPGFRQTTIIEEKIAKIKKALENSNSQKVSRLLKDAEAHLSCQQIRYAKGKLYNDLNKKLAYRSKGTFHPGLVDRMRIALNVYEKILSQDWIDLSTASEAYWNTVNVFDSALQEQEERNEKEKPEKDKGVRLSKRDSGYY